MEFPALYNNTFYPMLKDFEESRRQANFSLRKIRLRINRQCNENPNVESSQLAFCRRADDDFEVRPRERSDIRQRKTLSQHRKNEATSSTAMQWSSLRC